MSKTSKIYLVLCIWALPSAYWTAFEMYGLTLGGSQMLFYSISHAMPIMFVLVALSLPGYIALGLFNILLLFLSFKHKIEIPKNSVAIVLLFQAFHITALFIYDFWSNSFIRLLVCILGLAFLFITTKVGVKFVKKHNLSNPSNSNCGD